MHLIGQETGELVNMSKSMSRWLLALIAAVYCIFGGLYAARTPRWQTPDEPAHYNYIQYVAQHASFPVLEVGDYPAAYLEEIKAARFPPYMSVSTIRYESHQPPLYYALAAVLYRLTAGLPFDWRFLALRLLSVVFGAALLLVAFRLMEDVFPEEAFLALAGTAFIAVVPMHLSLTAAINNDTLAELLLTCVLWQCVRASRNGFTPQRAAFTGILVGLALLTKTTVYLPAVGVTLVAVWLSSAQRHDDRPVVAASPGSSPQALEAATSIAVEEQRRAHVRNATGTGLRTVLYMFVPALLLATPWFVRNLVVYGNGDFLIWRRHELVVAGQLRTAEWLAQVGPARLLASFVLTTFRSFWAQFGWMGVLVDERIYLGLAVLTIVLKVGFASFLLQLLQGRVLLSRAQRLALALLALSALLTLLTYLSYNLGFAQHQGRYLFPALGPLGLAAALSLRELSRPQTARPVAAALLAACLLLAVYGLLGGDLPKSGMALLSAGAALLATTAWAPARWRSLPPAALYAGFLVLDWVCLFVYVLPNLGWRIG